MSQLNKADVLNYMTKYPTNGVEMMSLLGHGEQFVKVMSTPVGMELIKLLEVGITRSFNKIVDLKASEEDKIRWAIYRDLLDKICKKTLKYYNTKEAVAKGVK